MRLGDVSDFKARARTEGMLAFVGIELLIVVSIVAKIAARDRAGLGSYWIPKQRARI